MGISFVTNNEATGTLNNLDKASRKLAANIERLSSGLRINKAGDDAAGLAISEGLKSQIRGKMQAQRNASDGVSMTQVAEGAMDQIAGALGRMRELAVQAANDTYDDTTRTYMNDEVKSLRDEIERIAKVTDFNGKSLLSSKSTFTFWVGANGASATNAVKVDISGMTAVSLGGATAASSVASVVVSSASKAVSALAVLDLAISAVSSARGKIGAAQNRLSITIDNLAGSTQNLQSANSRIRDVDVAQESADYSRNSILRQAGVSVLAQAQQLPSIGLSLLR